MRVLMDGIVFNAELSAFKTREPNGQVLIIDHTIALTTEDLALLDCILVEAAEDEKEALGQAGFGSLVKQIPVQRPH